MDLYLVRHARAGQADPERWPDDRERPLTADGARRFRPVARALRDLGVAPDVVLASPLTRAWQTAELLARWADWPAPTACAALEPDQPPAAALEALQPYAQARSLALVGHEPHLHLLLSRLLSGADDLVQVELKKGAAAGLRCDEGPRAGSASLRWLLTPALARAAR